MPKSKSKKHELVPVEAPLLKVTPIVRHEVAQIRECSLGSDGLIWNDGWNKIVCTCGWTSAPLRGRDKNVALVALFEVHVRAAIYAQSLGVNRA